MGMKFALICCHMFGLLFIVNNGKAIELSSLPCYESRSCYSRPTRKGIFDDFIDTTDQFPNNDAPGLKTYFRVKGDDKSVVTLPMGWKQAIRDLVALAMSDSRQHTFTSATRPNMLTSSSNWNDVQKTDSDEYYVDNNQYIKTNNIPDNRLSLWKILTKNRI